MAEESPAISVLVLLNAGSSRKHKCKPNAHFYFDKLSQILNFTNVEIFTDEEKQHFWKKKSMKSLKSKIYDRQPSSFIQGVKNRWCSELCFTLQAEAVSQWLETEPATEQPKPGLGWVMLSALGSCCNCPRAFLHLVVYLFVFSQTCTVLEESIPRPLPDRLYQQSQNERFVKVFQVVPTLHSL